MNWAQTNDYVVMTMDLDFGAILAATGAYGPSVIQLRTQSVMIRHLAPTLIPLIKRWLPQLQAGVLIIVDRRRSRVRILPLLQRRNDS